MAEQHGVTEDTREVMGGKAQGETRAQAWRNKPDFFRETRQRDRLSKAMDV